MKLLYFGLILFLFFPFVIAAEGVNQEYYTITKCSDSDGVNPSVLGELKYNYTGSLGIITNGRASMGDVCSFHYWYVLKYSGYKFRFRENVLVENVCPSNNLSADSPGVLQEQTLRFYKCKCKGIEGGQGKVEGANTIIGGICTNTPEEIPAKLVFEAQERWIQDGRPGPSWIERILKAFGWYG